LFFLQQLLDLLVIARVKPSKFKIYNINFYILFYIIH